MKNRGGFTPPSAPAKPKVAYFEGDMKTSADVKRELAQTRKLVETTKTDLEIARSDYLGDTDYVRSLEDNLQFYNGKINALVWVGEAHTEKEKDDELQDD